MNLKLLSDILTSCGFISIILSMSIMLSGEEHWAIFVGLWSPTFFILSNKFKIQS